MEGLQYLYDVKTIHYGSTRYWQQQRMTLDAGWVLEARALAVPRDYERAAHALDVRTDTYYRQTGRERPAGAPTAVGILATYPPVQGLVFGSMACGGSGTVGTLLDAIATSSAQRQWRTLGTRTVGEARAYFVSTVRRRVSFHAALGHARLRLGRLQELGFEGRRADRSAYGRTHTHVSAAGYDRSAADWCGNRGFGRDPD